MIADSNKTKLLNKISTFAQSEEDVDDDEDKEEEEDDDDEDYGPAKGYFCHV